MNLVLPTKQIQSANLNHLFPHLDSLKLIKTLNYGTTSKVKLAKDNLTEKEYAVKIIKPEFQTKYLSTIEQEARFLTLLSIEGHTNIVKLVECRPKADYTKKNGTIKKVFALIFELAEGGDLFECIKAFGDFQEDIARTYFHQLINTIQYLHDRGIIHGDLKLENLLLGGDFSLKIADFSFASFALEETNVPVQRQRLGTMNYMTPEVLANMDSVGQSNDLFACGIILFLMVVGSPPFEKASVQDIRYRLIIKQQFSIFWKQFEARGRSFSEDFKNLINVMFAFEPTERLSICEIASHPWWHGKTCLIEELKAQYDARKQDFYNYQELKAKQMQKMKEAKALKKKEIENKITQPKLTSFYMKGISPLNHRSITINIDQEIKNRMNQNDDISKERVTREYIFTGYRRISELFYNVNQKTMFKLILLLSDQIFNNYKVHQEEYKIKGRIISDNDDFTGELFVEISHIDEDSCCISFTKIKGALASFYKFIEEKFQAVIDSTLEKLEEHK